MENITLDEAIEKFSVEIELTGPLADLDLKGTAGYCVIGNGDLIVIKKYGQSPRAVVIPHEIDERIPVDSDGETCLDFAHLLDTEERLAYYTAWMVGAYEPGIMERAEKDAVEQARKASVEKFGKDIFQYQRRIPVVY